jgi:CDP-diacylglycerol--glycerol-3-phosphate 3-phosphatidyltransferase
MRILPEWLVSGGERFRSRIARPLAGRRIDPNMLTVLSFLCGVASGAAFAFGRIFPAWILLVSSGVLDMIDGRVAELSGRTSRFGAILDSTLDRYAEFAIFGGLIWHFRESGVVGLAALAMVGSIMVSYTRARAESLGVECRAGLAQRPERFAAIGTAAFFGSVFPVFDIAMGIALGAIALFANVTAVQRIFLVRRAERDHPVKGTTQ